MDKKFEVNLPFDKSTSGAKVSVSLVSGRNPIIGFAQIDFGFVKIKGCTIKEKDFKHDGNTTLTFDLPAYRAGQIFVKSAYFPDKQFYGQITNAVINKVREELGYTPPNNEEDVNPDDIPF